MYSVKVPSIYSFEDKNNEVQLEIKKIVAQEKGINRLDIEGNITAISNSKEE